MKKIWARISMTVEVTDEEYEKLRSAAEYTPGSYDDLDVPDWLLKKYAAEGKVDEDSYIPVTTFEYLEEVI